MGHDYIRSDGCVRIDFAVAVSSRAVRISSRAVCVFPALSLRRIQPSYGTFSLKVRTGPYGSYDNKNYQIHVLLQICTLIYKQLPNKCKACKNNSGLNGIFKSCTKM